MATKTKVDPAAAVEAARKVISTAQRKAKKIGSDPAVNRTTRARHATTIKAQALDEVSNVLAGKA